MKVAKKEIRNYQFSENNDLTLVSTLAIREKTYAVFIDSFHKLQYFQLEKDMQHMFPIEDSQLILKINEVLKIGFKEDN